MRWIRIGPLLRGAYAVQRNGIEPALEQFALRRDEEYSKLDWRDKRTT